MKTEEKYFKLLSVVFGERKTDEKTSERDQRSSAQIGSRIFRSEGKFFA